MIAASNVQDVIQRAVLTLAGRCDGARTNDGVGYNRYDAQWGQSAADAIMSGQSVDVARALKVVSKYRKQLAGAGIELPSPDVVSQEIEARRAERLSLVSSAPPASIGITAEPWTKTSVMVRFAYSPAKVEAIKTLPDRKFDPKEKGWIVPLSGLAGLQAVFPDLVLTGTLGADLDASKAKAEAEEQQRLALIARDLACYDLLKPTLGLTPYAHQDTGIRWLIENRFAILADDMGLGKTLQALIAARAIGHRIFVVCPKSLRINWLREAEALGVAIEVFSWAKIPPAVSSAYTLIADEAHYAQNMKSQRTKNFLELAKGAAAVFALTGTPLKNGRPANLYPLLLATRHPISKDRKRYEITFCNAGPTKWSQWDTTGAAHLEELHAAIADGLLRRMKDECLDLPAKTRVITEAEVSPDAQALYDATLHEMQQRYRRGKVEKAESLRVAYAAAQDDEERARIASKLANIDNADVLVLLGHVNHAGALAKVEWTIDKAEEVIEQGGSIVLFTRYLDVVEQLVTSLNALHITGEDNEIVRQHAVDAFQAGKVKAIVCTSAGGVGLTLTAAQTVILVDRPWTPGDAFQYEDRLHRIGQTGNVLALWPQVGTADALIDAILEEKYERSELILTGTRKTLPKVRSLMDVAEAVLG